MQRFVLVLALACSACGSSSVVIGDAGSDGGALDAGTPDAGRPDAGAPDSGAPDAGVPDAGLPDSGVIAMNGGDTCAQALDVTGGGTFAGSTESATDDYGPSGAGCPTGGAASGRDVTYVVRPTSAKMYTVRVTPSAATPSFDPMLYAVTTCGGSGCVAGTVLNGPGQPEEISFAVAANQSVFIVVDGELASRGQFELAVTAQ